MQSVKSVNAVRAANGKVKQLSYKFQRLRERIRSAILAGDFPDRLPGERELGRIFEANAKTINKALSDLSSEGLLIRQIGRGTFISTRYHSPVDAIAVNLLGFMPELGEESHLQKRLFDAIQTAVRSQGHSLQRASTSARHADKAVRLQDWPTPQRRSTDGMVFIPVSPLSGHGHQPDESLVLEAHRRRVPSVVLGAHATGMKLHAVLPDYVDAGFRLAEHLLRLGCDTVVAVHGSEGREIEEIVNGGTTAAARYGGSIQRCPLRSGLNGPTAACVNARFHDAQQARPRGRIGPTIGVMLIGMEALRFARSNDDLMKRWRTGEVALVTILDAGDTLAADMEMTSYDVPVDHMAAWGLKLLTSAKSGQQPVEVLIPGVLKLRNSISPTAALSAAHGDSEGAATLTNRSNLTEVAI